MTAFPKENALGGKIGGALPPAVEGMAVPPTAVVGKRGGLLALKEGNRNGFESSLEATVVDDGRAPASQLLKEKKGELEVAVVVLVAGFVTTPAVVWAKEELEKVAVGAVLVAVAVGPLASTVGLSEVVGFSFVFSVPVVVEPLLLRIVLEEEVLVGRRDGSLDACAEAEGALDGVSKHLNTSVLRKDVDAKGPAFSGSPLVLVPGVDAPFERLETRMTRRVVISSAEASWGVVENDSKLRGSLSS